MDSPKVSDIQSGKFYRVTTQFGDFYYYVSDMKEEMDSFGKFTQINGYRLPEPITKGSEWCEWPSDAEDGDPVWGDESTGVELSEEQLKVCLGGLAGFPPGYQPLVPGPVFKMVWRRGDARNRYCTFTDKFLPDDEPFDWS